MTVNPETPYYFAKVSLIHTNVHTYQCCCRCYGRNHDYSSYCERYDHPTSCSLVALPLYRHSDGKKYCEACWVLWNPSEDLTTPPSPSYSLYPASYHTVQHHAYSRIIQLRCRPNRPPCSNAERQADVERQANAGVARPTVTCKSCQKQTNIACPTVTCATTPKEPTTGTLRVNISPVSLGLLCERRAPSDQRGCPAGGERPGVGSRRACGELDNTCTFHQHGSNT